MVILLDDKEQVSSTLSMASQRRPVAGDNEMELSSGSTADMMMHFDVKDSDGMSVMNASCAGTYGKALLNRYVASSLLLDF